MSKSIFRFHDSGFQLTYVISSTKLGLLSFTPKFKPTLQRTSPD